MCIIAHKPAGVHLMGDDVLFNCFENNPDGAGLMYLYQGSVRIIKGFMRFTDLLESLLSLEKKVKSLTDIDMVIHFRYATQGSICAQNCHPFPCSSNDKDLRSLNLSALTGIAHNGVINFCSTKKRSKLSDTQIFIRDYLSRIPYRDLYNSAINKLIYEATNSKFAIMSQRGVDLIGPFVDHKGIFYSNSSFMVDDRIKKWCFDEDLDYCDSCGKLSVGEYFYDMWLCPQCLSYFNEDY